MDREVLATVPWLNVTDADRAALIGLLDAARALSGADAVWWQDDADTPWPAERAHAARAPTQRTKPIDVRGGRRADTNGVSHMTVNTIEFLFDFGSPTTYLAHTQMPKLAADSGAHIDYVPMLLGGVFKATGNQSPVMVPAKGRWMGTDLVRCAHRYGVPFQFNPHFPINTLTLMRGAVGLQMREPARFMAYVDAVFRAMWVEPVNLGDPTALAATLGAAGFDATAFMALVGDAEVKARLIANTEAAVARGVFGAPTFFVGDEMFFGQDRLDFVREAVTGA